MKDLLSRRYRSILDRLKHDPRALLAFDFDGTIVPLYHDPDDVHLASSTRRLLQKLCRSHRCVVITGRALRDVAPRLKGLPLAGIIGNHGMEWTFGPTPIQKYVDRVRRWRLIIEKKFPQMVPGVFIEDKKYSLSLHWREARRKSLAKQQLRAAAEALKGARLIDGKDVINVMPRGAPDKGIAFRKLCRRLGAQRAFYIGDDVTDEFVFQLSPPKEADWCFVRVGARGKSHAPYRLKRQSHIDRLLKLLT